MAIEMIPLNKLRPSKDNPRKRFDDESIKGLAQSILSDGLQQNLVVERPAQGKRKFDIIAGERRFRAFTHLVDQGHFPKNVTLPCEVRENLSTQDRLRLATVENMQRQDLSPLEEAQAIATLASEGDSMDDIASKTGLSDSTIKRRMVLLELSPAAKDALAGAEITLTQAEALTIGTHDEQDNLLERVKSGFYGRADEIRDRLTSELPTVAMAIFDKAAYQGDYTTDLFHDAQTTYFNDAEQFFDLQKQAAEKLTAQLDAQNDWAELVQGRFSPLEYDQAQKGQSGGVVVCLKHDGSVEVHKGLIRKDIDASVSDALKAAPKAAYARTVCEYIAMHKSAGVQAELLKNPRKAKEIGVARMLYQGHVHPCLDYLGKLEGDKSHLEAINEEAGALYAMMGLEGHFTSYGALLSAAHTMDSAFDLIQTLDDAQLERLFVFLSALTFGQECCDALDTKEHSLFNRVAIAVGADMRDYWKPSAWFLLRRTLPQLQRIIKETGLNRLYGNGAGFKKRELVKMMVSYFEKVVAFKKPKPDQQQARDWLPEAMSFPAIDPDAQREAPEENTPAAPEPEAGAEDLAQAA